MSARAWRLFLAGIVAMGVGWLVWVVASERPAPGPVAQVHAQLPELEGGQACSACHGRWLTSMQTACLQCHADIAGQLQDGSGLHGRLTGDDGCARCHGEHHGPAFQLVNRLAFAQVGVADPAAFDHARIGFVMRGPHLEQTCTRCHVHADDKVLAPGTRRYLGLDQDCSTCHRDVHGGTMALGCARCHGQVAWQQLEPPGHERFVALIGGHGGLSCTRCHAGGRAFERLGRADSPAPRVCVDCHESPHTPDLIANVARDQNVAPGAACAVCHLPAHTAFRSSDGRMDVALHALTSFPLSAPHARVACSGCHPPDGASYRQRYPGRAPDDCAVCHADPHGGQFADLPAAARGCAGCHLRDQWQPAKFGRREHAATALPLDGRHAEIDCDACHVAPAPGQPKRYRKTASRCEACHADAHRGAFARIDRQLAGDRRGRCAVCHVTTTFATPGPRPFDHALATGFAVDGAHAQVECETCHKRQVVPDDRGRTFGRALPGGGVASCPTCHKDPHAGRFDGRGLPASVGGRKGCERCHDTVSFRALPSAFDHATFTGFLLDGAHQRAACTVCHARLPAADRNGRTWAPAPGRLCADCHRDPHAGQFLRVGRTECARCHRTAEAWQQLSFDHDRDSRFALVGSSRVDLQACKLEYSIVSPK